MADDDVKNFPKIKISLPAGPRINVVAALCFLIPGGIGAYLAWAERPWWQVALCVLAGCLLALSPKIAKQWERGVVLRLGRYVGLRGPGLFWIVPLVDSVTVWIDQRTITTNFAAEQTLTSDTVPVNVDAVLFWMVYDPEKAALEVQDYAQAVSWAAQTALRDIIGRTSLTDLLRGTRADRARLAEADRHADQSVGRDGAVGRDARRDHPRCAAGRHVARGPGGPGEASPHHPRPGRGGDCRTCSGRRRSRTTTIRRRCICGR